MLWLPEQLKALERRRVGSWKKFHRIFLTLTAQVSLTDNHARLTLSALTFSREGCEVIACDLNAEALKSLQGLKGNTAQCIVVKFWVRCQCKTIHWIFSGVTTAVLDVTDAKAIDELALRYPKVDILFNCVG